MPENEKYVIPRKIAEAEKPRKTRSKHIEEVQFQLMKSIDRIVELAKKLEPEIERHNQKVKAKYKKQFEGSKQKAMPTQGTLQRIEQNRFLEYRSAYKEAYYTVFAEFIARLESMPDIDSLNPFSIQPGDMVELNGTCFGPSQGKIMLEITSSGGVVELEVFSWTDTRVVASLSVFLIGLRPHYGKIWLQTGDGKTSNTWPIQFIPLYEYYIGGWDKTVDGGLFGKSKDGIANEGVTLNDPDFSIFLVNSSHSGDGWSKLQYPNAGGQRLEQGYHIGVAACGSAQMTIFYHMKGPKGIATPSVGTYWWDTGTTYY